MAHGDASGCAGVAAGYGVSNRSTSRCDGDPGGATARLRAEPSSASIWGPSATSRATCRPVSMRVASRNRKPSARPPSLFARTRGQIQSLGELEDVLELMGDVLERPGIERNHYASDSDPIFGDAESGLGSKLRCFDPWPEDGSRRFATPRLRRCCAPRSKSCWPCLDY